LAIRRRRTWEVSVFRMKRGWFAPLVVIAAAALMLASVPAGAASQTPPGAQTLPTVAVTSTTNGHYDFSPNSQPCSPGGELGYIVSTSAQFILTRTGDTTSMLTVDIAWSGTATEGTVVAPTSVEFAAGSATATVTPTFTPTPSPNGGISDVTLTVLSGAGYELGNPPNGTAYLDFPVFDCAPPPTTETWPPPPPPPTPPPPPKPVESHPTFTG
jgi:hypothetical protein